MTDVVTSQWVEKVDRELCETLLNNFPAAVVHRMNEEDGYFPITLGNVLEELWSSGCEDRAVQLVADLLSAVRGAEVSQPSYQQFLTKVQMSRSSNAGDRDDLIDYIDERITSYYANAKIEPDQGGK